MNRGLVLAIDQGTTNTKAILVDDRGRIVARAAHPLVSAYPQPGWAEQSADAIWESVRAVIAAIAAQADRQIEALAIANQRETLVVWDGETGRPIAPAILWQCRRSTADCKALIAAGHDPAVTEATGLSINALFPAAKLGWVMKHVPEAARLHAAGRLRAGTVDSWLLFNLTGGAVFATDHSNASRTQLFNTATLAFDQALGAIFGAPVKCLPEPLPSDSRFGTVAEGVTALAGGVPILAMMGDSHAALYGHGVREPGLVKATYGTGSSLMTLTPERVLSRNGLSATIAWSDRTGTAYALEGNITVSAQAAAFVASLLGVGDAAALSALAETVPGSEGVVFVPALAGLGAPHWNDEATGTISGMAHATTAAHVARATFEAITLQIRDVFSAMERDIGVTLTGLLADGGASSNAFLMQLQAHILDRPVTRADEPEVGALGVAAMAWTRLGGADGAAKSTASAPFLPEGMAKTTRESILSAWQSALSRAMQS